MRGCDEKGRQIEGWGSMQFIDSVIHLDIRSSLCISRTKFIYDLMHKTHQG